MRQELQAIRQQIERQAIISAYPDYPQMWRYLERNPRHIAYYLGYGDPRSPYYQGR